jgi:hypothetical protein
MRVDQRGGGHAAEEVADQLGHLVTGALQDEVPAVEQVDLGVRHVLGERRERGLGRGLPERVRRVRRVGSDRNSESQTYELARPGAD